MYLDDFHRTTRNFVGIFVVVVVVVVELILRHCEHPQ